ncbi:hypothetical protein CRG98_038139, partial [Punica granatum]
MGCCESSLLRETHPEKDTNAQGTTQQSRSPPPGGAEPAQGGIPVFSGFSLSELRAATSNFSSEFIVSESGEKAPNWVYRGRLKNGSWIAVKKFSKIAWPDPKQFVDEAGSVGKLRHKRLANLIGYCCEGDERLLVAEYMPNDTLAKHLFH